MRYIISIFLLLPISLTAQSKFIAIFKNKQSCNILSNSTVIIKSLKKTAIADTTGKVIINNIPKGKYLLEFSHVGFKELEKTFVFPLSSEDVVDIFLEPDVETLTGVIINSTRSNRSMGSTPSRVEVISDEEIHEEGEMRPGDIKMLLGESTGIQTQQTSATSGNASIRLQGLDGRYTQILKDGFPIYSGAAAGLGLLQTPPLDLRQVEVFKGSASTLYGGGAIAGIINLISKIPTEKRELNFHVNGTTAEGLDINSFYSQKFDKAGMTLFLSRNSNGAYAPANAIFTAIPKFERYTINPKFFYAFNPTTQLMSGVNISFEDRLGGDINYIKNTSDPNHTYFENNKTRRLSTEFSIDHHFNSKSDLVVKNSVSYFNRKINSGPFLFEGREYSSFSEVSYNLKSERSDFVIGSNLITEQFKVPNFSNNINNDYSLTTLGLFAQHTWNSNRWLTLESGLRIDFHNYGANFLPRVSVLFKITDKLTTRIGGGFGYKLPTIFTEETERLLYKNILPIDPSVNKSERSYGINGDVNYKFSFDKLKINLNQFFFYTYIINPLELIHFPNNFYKLINSDGNINSRGAETNIKFSIEDISLYIGYTYTSALLTTNGKNIYQPLTPKHRINAALLFEIGNKWKFGSEFYYFSKQPLKDGTTGNSYCLYGALAEKVFKKFSIYINFENFGDVRQTKFGEIYTGSITNPVFKDIYAPLEGFTANSGIKIKL